MPSPRSAEIQRAMSMRSQGQPQQALEKLNRLANEHPNDGELWQLTGFVALESFGEVTWNAY